MSGSSCSSSICDSSSIPAGEPDLLDTGEGGPGDGMPMPCACMAASSTSGGDDGVKASSMSDVELTSST
eukprot:CAMPEP_0202415122 /NCGR_PEP_ID=MMETSP1128-20130828/35090_1 /ASSEMBLY_ACC=CAM_ASM_000463 /TAXON_ID=3047 /ORGANISM="Dunaliella tertiolecta, Strain CCMP1320" /LENGTH=68 /DNA_ID=CAMNT_0049021717 /DNA_START=114 /DNA_END=316 /DNA_ORIENTATION=+